MPFAESMISTLKSNKSIMLDKSRRFRKTLGGYNKNRKTEYNFPKATPEQLKAIREKLKKENQVLLLKIITVFVITIAGLILVMIKA